MDKTKYEKNRIIFGWKIKQAEKLPDLKLEFIELEHIATGAKYVHIARADSENVFCMAFKTIPEDGSGIAHILEHTVLAGSKNYPVRDPFFSMRKRSLHTFMNAFTGNDWTAYPFATENKKDYYNLMAVYLDAVFHPLLTKMNFKQEGWRLEFDKCELKFKGVVYNEMKGSMSSPERIIEEAITKSLFPTGNYRFNSGGDPEMIPNLTHADLKKFHARFYHPSNAFFYSYGDLPFAGHLKFLHGKIMKNFTALKIDSQVRPEPRWRKPNKFIYKYPLERSADARRKYQAVLAWLMAPVADAKEMMVLELLEDILLDNPASPLRRALIESGLGSGLVDASGFNSELKESVFTVGLKDIEKEKISQVKAIIISTLKKLLKTGISPEIINSSLQKLEITHMEAVNQPYPYGLKLWFRFIIPHIHGGNPLAALSFAEDIKALRKNLKQEKFLEKKIEKYFLNNKHEALIILEPDKNMQVDQEKRERKTLGQIKKRLSAAEKDLIIKEARELRDLQEKKEDLRSLPGLEIKDIPLQVKMTKERKLACPKALANYSANTNGIFYWSAIFPITSLSHEELALVPLFCHVLPLLGTKRKDYLSLAEAISAHTGGVSAGFQVGSDYHHNDSGASAYIALASKCLAHNVKEMYAICRELILEFDFSNTKALKKFVLEYRAYLETGIVDEGHYLAMSLAGKNLSPVMALKELWDGLSQYGVIKIITKNLSDKGLRELAAKLSEIGKKLFTEERIRILHIGDEKALYIAVKMADALLVDLNYSEQGLIKNNKKETGLKQILKLEDEKIKAGRYLASSVSFVAACFKTADMKHADSPSLFVLSKILSWQYLHAELREKGGAYGGFARYDRNEGVFSLGSYRDPHIISTLNVFSNAKNFILNNPVSKKEIAEAILQVCADLSRPGSPAEEARSAFYRKLFGISDKDRQDYKKRVLKVGLSDLKHAAKKYLKDNWQDYDVAVISNQKKLEEVRKQLGFEIREV